MEPLVAAASLRAPPALVYAVVADLPAWGRWRPGVQASSATPPGSARPGHRALLRLREAVERRVVAETWVPQRIEFEVEREGRWSGRETWTFARDGLGTRVTRSLDVRLAGWWGQRRARREIAAEMVADLLGLRSFSEAPVLRKG